MNEIETPPVQTPGSQKRKTGFRLFKRADNGSILAQDAPGWRERDYYFQVQCRGQRFLRCLGTNDAVKAQNLARAKAREIKEAFLREDLARLNGTKIRVASVATGKQLIAAYEACAVDAGEKTRAGNVNAWKQIVREVLGADPETVAVNKMDATVCRRWFELATAKIQEAPDQQKQASLRRSANSRFNQARCLYAPKALAAYKDKGIACDAMEKFTEAFKTFRFKGGKTVTDYNPPSDEITQQTLADWEKIEDRNLFLAIGHELAFGLRIGEIGQAKWSWWTTRQGYPVIDATADVKNQSGLIQVRALDPFFTSMRERVEANKWKGEPDDFIITGTMTARTDAIYRAASEFLRRHGWETKKTNHALRAYSGSQIAMKYGIYEASTWLRHSTVKVTENNYSHFVKRFRPTDPDALPARWALAATGPVTLKVVAA